MPIIVEPGTAGSITYTIDPTSEDAGNTPLELVDNSTQHLTAEELPTPAEQPIWASSADTEGAAPVSNRHENRQVTLTVRLHGTSETDLDAKILAISEKVEKLRREGGTLQRTLPSGESYVLDVLSGTTQPVWGQRGYVANWRIDVTLSLTCKPYWRGAEEDLGDNTETTLPALVFTDTGVKGDVPALGRLVISDAQAVDQAWAIWGAESRNYSSSANAALYYEAESRTPLGAGAATTAGPTGASGSGSNTILANSLATSYQAIMSTQASGGGAHLQHVGTFRVFARVQVPAANAGGVTLALEWAQGDFRSTTRNAAYALSPYPSSFTNGWRGVWLLADLGLVNLTKDVGTQRWEGRIIAKSTALDDDVYIDSIFLVPTEVGSGVATAVLQTTAPTSFLDRDEFNQTAGALAGKVAPVGGTWTGGGDTDDFAIDVSTGTARRTAVSDALGLQGGRVAWPDTASASNVGASVDIKMDNQPAGVSLRGLALRIVDASNYLIVGVTAGQPLKLLTVYTVVAGTATAVGSLLLPNQGEQTTEWQTLRVFVTPTGVVYAAYGTQGFTRTPQPIAFSSLLATGGTLAAGKTGIYDFYSQAAAFTRYWDDLRAWAPVADAAVFASQSLEVRHDRALREDSTGVTWQKPSYAGNYLRIPPAGAEGRTLRMFVKTSRNNPRYGADAGIDDISARLYVTPRYLHVPE